MERPDEVLALRQVDPGLATDRRVDLGDERRRDLDGSDPAEVDGGEEPGRVAKRAPTDGNEHVAALDAEGGELAGSGLDDGQALGGLTLGDHDRGDVAATGAKVGGQPFADRAPGAGLADQDRALGAHRRQLVDERLGGDPLAEHDPTDRRRGAQEGGAASRLLAHATRELRLDRVDDALHLADPRMMDVAAA